MRISIEVCTVGDLIRVVGGTVIAREMGVSRQAVSRWKQNGFPRDYETVDRLRAMVAARGIDIDPMRLPVRVPTPARLGRAKEHHNAQGA